MAGLLSRAVIAVAAALVAIGSVVAATGFLIGALYLYLLAVPMTPGLAALTVGLVLLTVAALVVVAAWIVVRPRRPRPSGAAPAGGRDTLAAGLGNIAAREAVAAAEAHPYYAFSAAFLAGLALGGSPEVQDLVKTVLKASNSSGGDAK